MIAYVQGKVVLVEGNAVVVKAGGVGYEVFAPDMIVAGLLPGNDVEFYVSTVVKEDSITLYGFAKPGHRRIFDMLRGVSGIGPKTALAVLSAIDAPELVALVADESWKPLTRVSGVGKKTAQRIVLELKERFQGLAAQMPATKGRATPVFSELRAALQALGYKEREIVTAIERLQDRGMENQGLADLVKLAIREISKR